MYKFLFNFHGRMTPPNLNQGHIYKNHEGGQHHLVEIDKSAVADYLNVDIHTEEGKEQVERAMDAVVGSIFRLKSY